MPILFLAFSLCLPAWGQISSKLGTMKVPLSTSITIFSWLLVISAVIAGWFIPNTCNMSRMSRIVTCHDSKSSGHKVTTSKDHLLSVDGPDVVHLLQSRSVSRRESLQKTT